MIAEALCDDIKRYARDVRSTNQLFVHAANGSLTHPAVSTYLANLHELVSHTPVHLSRASSRARALGLTPLADYFGEKCGDEAGHDAWARTDLSRLAPRGIRHDVLPAMRERIERLEEIIDEDPELYLAYVLFAEYATVLLGGDWLNLLETRCGIPRSSMTVIDNHVELDREHVSEALERIDSLVGDPRKLTRLRAVLQESFALWDRFGEEVCAAPESEQARHVPAA
jgi:pyrroloquinoline quinone (PQQ) biosynthesis protein C